MGHPATSVDQSVMRFDLQIHVHQQRGVLSRSVA